ncbi:hypothetical protein AURDEDRAFT_182634 [Auricularia subglabra TFB-10046 SS5]|nr:hypothetical protein AURDEDRAFT_182634 [Auricularia subglabra TFB-10046 SS5]
MVTDADSPMEPPRKRFKHQSYKSAIREVHLPSAVQSTQLDEDLAENETHFQNALDNIFAISSSFSPAMAHSARSSKISTPMSTSRSTLRIELTRSASHRKCASSSVQIYLRTTLKPKFNELVDTLTSIIPRPQLSPRALTAVLSALASVFRLLQPDESMLTHAHTALLNALRKCSPEVQSAGAEVWGAVLRRAKGPARDAVVAMTLAPLIDSDETTAGFVGAHAFVAACEVMTSWSSIARPLIDWSWSGAPSFSLELCGTVAALGWIGWSAIGLPAFTKRVPSLFAADADPDTARLATRVLAELCANALAPAADDATFWDAVRGHVDHRLGGWTLSEDNVVELSAMLKLTPVLSRVEAKLDVIIERLLDGDINPDAGWVLGRCFEALSHTKDVDVEKWTPRVLERWTVDEHAMSGFVALVQATPSVSVTLPLETALPALRSHKRALRFAALRLSAPDANAAVRHMLAAEECTLDVAGSRGRTVRITKLPALLGTVDNAKLGIAWLLGQLKVNLRPVWDPATKALAELAGRCGEDVWEAVWEELDRDEDMDVDPRPADDDGEDEEDGVVKEAERTWRCPAAANVERAVRRWRADGSSARREVLKAQRPTVRLDGANYTTQLLRTLALVPALPEKHSRLLVPKFLALAEANMKGKLAPYLALFSKFGNPKALYRTSELHAIYLGLLAHPDRAIQRDALACVQSYKAPAIARLSDSLGGLLDETKWRDEMVGLTGAAADAPLDADAEDVLVRVCYGLMTERRAGKERRAAALTLVGALGERAMGVLVALMLSPFGGSDDGLPGEKQQLGFLAMLGDVLSALGTSTMVYWSRLLDATLACLGAAQRTLDSNDSDDNESDNDDTKDGGTRAVRLGGLKRFADFFRVPSDFDFAPYVARAFTCAISPRLPAFDRENTQAPSALLQMFVAWSGEPRTIRFLVDCDSVVLPKTFALLAAPSVKPPVVARVLDVADRILALSDEDTAIAEAVLLPHVGALLDNLQVLPHVGALLDNLAVLVARSTAAGKGALGDLVQRQISILSRIAGHLLSGLFSMLRMRAARSAAAAAFAKLCGDQDEVATLVSEMNAFSVKRIEEPDFERRFNAFKTLNDGLHAQLSARQWLPVLHNLLYFVQDTDELSLRNNAAYGLRRFVDRVAADEAGVDIMLAFSRVVYPAIKRALRSAAELVRAEVLGVLAHGVEKCDNMPSLVEMRGLLAGGDEEANFFNNIAHIQGHRRSRAMRRLVEYIDTGAVCSATLSQVFVPLVSHPIYNSGTTDHRLVNEAITTTGTIAKHLSWPAYFSLVQQYLRGIKEPKEKVPVKPLVRALVSILDNFHFPMDASVAAGSADAPVATEDVGEDDEPQPVEQWKADSRIMDAVTAKLLPSLLNILENREETEDGLRIPVCVGIVRIALHLPEQQRQPQVSRLLTVIAQIFRSKSQDTRDLTRETLCKIIVMLGPDYLAVAMKQLRGALLRGPHLHILAFVTHSILVHITSNATEQFATIDDSVADIAHVAAEVIFGQSGKDLQSEDFKTKLKEVKGSTSRGMDCFALVSKCISSVKVSTLLLPVRNIMEETESAKVMFQVDDVLRRVASGLNANPQLKPTDLLVMCHTLISQNARFLRETSTPSKKQGKIHPDVAVQVKRTLDAPTNHYINNSHRFIALGLDVFVTAARRSKFVLHDPDTLSRLEPMVNVIGNTLYSNNANVLTLGLKAAAAVIKYPLKNVNKAMPALTRQMFDVVKQAGSTESEVAQTALKTLAVLLRDAKSDSFKVKEVDLTFLLDILGPDLEEHERQATVFAVLRSTPLHDRAYHKYGRGNWEEALFYLHFLAMPAFAFMARELYAQISAANRSRRIVIGNLDGSVRVGRPLAFVPLPRIAIPSMYIPLALNVATSLVCVSGVHRLASSLTVTIILVVRKAVSLLITVILLGRGDGGAWL